MSCLLLLLQTVQTGLRLLKQTQPIPTSGRALIPWPALPRSHGRAAFSLAWSNPRSHSEPPPSCYLTSASPPPHFLPFLDVLLYSIILVYKVHPSCLCRFFSPSVLLLFQCPCSVFRFTFSCQCPCAPSLANIFLFHLGPLCSLFFSLSLSLFTSIITSILSLQFFPLSFPFPLPNPSLPPFSSSLTVMLLKRTQCVSLNQTDELGAE